MTTMKSFLSALLLSGIVIFSSCKKDDAPKVDPRDAFVGEYEMVADCGVAGDGEGPVEFKKDSKDAKYIIMETELFEALDVEFDDDIKVAVTGKTFEAKDIEAIAYDTEGNAHDVEVSLDGKLDGKELEIEIEIKGQGGTVGCDLTGEKE